MKRDANIEFFRCICMAGVVLLHALVQGGYAAGHRGLDNLMTPSVVGFVFISGYFGIKCNLKSTLKLLGIGLSSYIMLAIVGGIGTNLVEIWGYWWFLWMYIALMAIAPIANAIFDEHRECVARKILPILLVVYVWSYSATKVPVLKNIVPWVDGFSSFGVLTFLGVYVAARASRLYEAAIKTKWLLVAAIAGGTVCWIGAYHYNSPFALVFAGSIFYLVKRIDLLSRFPWLAKLTVVISPSIFSVYLIHTNAFGFELIRKAEEVLISAGWNYYCVSLMVATGIFVGCIILDIPRRLVARYIVRWIYK